MHFSSNWLAQQLHHISSFELNLELYVVMCDVLIPTTLGHFSPMQFPLHIKPTKKMAANLRYHQVLVLLYAMSRALCWISTFRSTT